jgi:hypothetical protein
LFVAKAAEQPSIVAQVAVPVAVDVPTVLVPVPVVELVTGLPIIRLSQLVQLALQLLYR